VTINVGRDMSGADQPIVSRDVVNAADSVGEVIVNVLESDNVPDVTINIARFFGVLRTTPGKLTSDGLKDPTGANETSAGVFDPKEGTNPPTK
jgi:hypothetical protein